MSSVDKDGGDDAKMLDSRVFIGNLPETVSRQEIENVFQTYGTILGVSLHKNYGFIQYEGQDAAKKSVEAMNGYNFHGAALGKKLDFCWCALIRI